MKIAALQLDIVWEDRQANYECVRSFAKDAADAGVDLLVLPEMFATGFSMNPSVTAEPINGDTPAFMRSLAREYNMGVLGGFVLQGTGGLGQNVALAVDRDGHDLACYSKSHLFSFLDEDQYHEPGKGPQPFSFAGVEGACFICYDLRFPELFRLVADECQIVCLIASWPQERQMHFDTLLPARAVENQYYVVGLNRVGVGGGLRFIGNSAIYDPFGNLIDRAEDQPRLLMADIDPAQVKELRNQMPFQKDRRF